jgi:hypothetical protein
LFAVLLFVLSISLTSFAQNNFSGSSVSSEEQLSFSQFVQELEAQLKQTKSKEVPSESERKLNLSLASSLIQQTKINPTMITGISLAYGKILKSANLASEFGVKYFNPQQAEPKFSRVKSSFELYAQMHILGKAKTIQPYFLFGMGLRDLSVVDTKGVEMNKFGPSLAFGTGILRRLGSASKLKMGASAHPYFDQMDISQTPLDFTLGLETLF